MIALFTISSRELARIRRIWAQIFAPPLISTLLYFVIFGKVLGRQLGVVEGYPYLQFILPGLVLMAVITSSYSNVCFSFFSAKFNRYVEELTIAPISVHELIWGYLSGGLFRGLVTGILVSVLASCLAHEFLLANALYALIFLILTALLFSLAGLLGAIFAETFDSVNFFPTFFLSPLTYLGGVFYSIRTLSPWGQKLVLLNPVFHIVKGFRAAFLGNVSFETHSALLVIICFCVFLYIACSKLLKREMLLT